MAAALDVPFGARPSSTTLSAGTGASTPSGGDGSNGHRRIDLTDHLIAFRLREHLHLPVQAIGVLLGIDPSTVSHATALTARLLASSGIPQPATAPRPGTLPRTPGELLDYAAAAGITIPAGIGGHTPPQIAHYKPPTPRKLN